LAVAPIAGPCGMAQSKIVNSAAEIRRRGIGQRPHLDASNSATLLRPTPMGAVGLKRLPPLPFRSCNDHSPTVLESRRDSTHRVAELPHGRLINNVSGMLDPRISVVITSYNQREFLVEAIESVVSQTLRPHEIIIADDASTDGSVDLIRGYVARNPGWVKALLQPRNVGVTRNRNDALSMVEGDLVTLLDGDDRFLPKKLELEYATYKAHPEAKIVHSNMYYIDPNGRRTRLWADGLRPPEGDVFPEVFARRYPRGTTFRNELVETRCIREVGGYDETLPRYSDWDLILRLTERFRTAYCPEPLTEYRRHPDSLSHAPGPVHIASVTRIYERYRPLLASLPEHDRLVVEKAIQRLLARLSRRSAMEAMDAQNRRTAFEYWAKSLPLDHEWSPVLLGRILLPTSAYAMLRSISREIVGRGSGNAQDGRVEVGG